MSLYAPFSADDLDTSRPTPLGRRLRAADPELLVSPFSGNWWRTTKLMIERGSRAFWARRPEAQPAPEVRPAAAAEPHP